MTIFASISEVVVNYDYSKACKLVQHDICLTCKYQGPHSPVRLQPSSKRVLSIFNEVMHLSSNMGGAN